MLATGPPAPTSTGAACKADFRRTPASETEEARSLTGHYAAARRGTSCTICDGAKLDG